MVGGSLTTLPFVLPYKRFAAPCLLSRAKLYLEEAKVTYRTSVQHDRQRIGYPVPGAQDASAHGDQVKEQSVVDHSLIWRMVGWLGSLTLSLNKAREMILQTVPGSLCHRYPGSVAPRKARKARNPERPDRLATLETARQLLLIVPEWEEYFDGKFFPRFATRSGFD